MQETARTAHAAPIPIDKNYSIDVLRDLNILDDVPRAQFDDADRARLEAFARLPVFKLRQSQR